MSAPSAVLGRAGECGNGPDWWRPAHSVRSSVFLFLFSLPFSFLFFPNSNLNSSLSSNL
jgi:hypothetical protein